MRKTAKFIIIFITVTICASFAKDGLSEMGWPERRRQIAQKRSLSKTLYGREDPFAPLFSKRQKEVLSIPKVELKLNGILWSKSDQSAFINGILVRVGDSIHGRKVIEIKREKVILEDDGKRYILTSSGLVEESK